MATSTLPVDIPTSTEISVITGKVEQYNASGTMEGYEYHYYTVPFFVWVVLGTIILFILSRLSIELIKQYRRL